jgi:hypothetical protein
MIGMDVGVDDEADAHPGGVGRPQIGSDALHRVHHGAGGVPAAAEQVGNRHRIGMEELTHDHTRLLRRSTTPALDRRHSINLQIDPTRQDIKLAQTAQAPELLEHLGQGERSLEVRVGNGRTTGRP